MSIFFTSDLHFGHANIIEYSDRPFANVDEMNVALIENWNSVVNDDDVVYVLGDVALGRIQDTLPLCSLLRGTKILFPGNHDRCWGGHRKGVAGWTEKYHDVGGFVVVGGQSEMHVGGQVVNLSHFPYEGDSHDEDRFQQHRPVDDGRWLLHGHVHEKWQVRGRQINVGVDVWDYRPVPYATLAEIVEE